MGDQITLADPYLYLLCSWLERDGVDVSAFPKIIAFRKVMNARASVQRAQAMGMLG